MRHFSLRSIFLVPILAAIVVGFTAFAIYADRFEHTNRVADIDAELVEANQGISANAGDRRPVGRPPANETTANEAPLAGEPPLAELIAADAEIDVDNPVELLIESDGSVIWTGISGNPFDPETLDMLTSVDGFYTEPDENYRVLVVAPERRDITVTALSLAGVDAAASDFRRAVALGGSIIALLIAVVVSLLVQSLTRPITRIASGASQIADGALDTALDTSSRSHEVAGLSTDLDRMLTQLKSTLGESERSAAEASQARDDMQRFLADVAHELRTPLTTLKGYSDLYAGGMLDDTEDVDRAMARIGSETERLYRLVDEMLQLARDGIANQRAEAVDVGAIAAAVTTDLSAANPDNTIRLATSPGTHQITGTPASIHQAILNLGANACHHSRRKDEVTIRVESTSGLVNVHVIDHGPGIDPAKADAIFLPFYREDTSRARDGHSGAGLGLAISKQIVEQHGGSITVDSTPGGGATFVLTLPAS